MNAEVANLRGAEPGAGGDGVPPAVEVAGLTKRFGGVLAVDNLAMTVPTGVVAGFVGPNGAGKTTTMRMLLGLIRPDRGHGTVLGQPLEEPDRFLHRVGALIEGPAFYPTMTGRQNLLLLARLGGFDARRADEALEVVGLTRRGRDPFRSYSLGMKQRLGIAAALLPEPDLLVLDEPANGLDPAGIHDIRKLLRDLAISGTSVLVSSHLLGEIEALCDWVILLDRGRRVYQGSVDELLEGGRGLVVRTLHAEQLEIVESVARSHGYPTTRNGDRVMVHAPPAFGGPLNQEAMRQGAIISELAVNTASGLEERFLAITGEARS